MHITTQTISTPTIGILALQGGFSEHAAMLHTLGVKTVWVRLAQHLDDVDGLIVPGGESTAVTRLLKIPTEGDHIHRDLWSAVRYHVMERHMPLWGSCAGAIVMAQHVEPSALDTLGLLPVTVHRNAFGSQMHSSIQSIHCSLHKEPVPAVLIRAPQITELHDDQVTVLAEWDAANATAARCILAVRYHHMLATVFHPELTTCPVFHRYFLTMVSNA